MDEQVGRIDPAPDDTRSAPPAPPTRPPTVPRRRGWIVRGLVILIVLGALVYLGIRFVPSVLQGAGTQAAGQTGTQATGSPAVRGAPAEPPQAVGAATIGRGDIRVILSELGTVTPLATVTVKTQINGQLTQVAFTEGQVVHKGDFLAQIDPRPYQVALEQAQGQLARDQALLKNAQLDQQRYRLLASQDSIARQQVDTQASLVRQYEGTLKTDQASIDSANLNLTYCHIVSPVDGRVGLRQVDAGNYVQTSDANGLVVITQLQPISVIFTITEDVLPQVVTHMRDPGHALDTAGGDKLAVTAFDRSNTIRLATGTLATLDNQVDTTTGTVKARAIFPNRDETLFPNQFVNARLLVNTLRDVVRLPVAGIQRGSPGTYVYLVGKNDTVSIHPVKLGPTDGDMTAVTSGLAPGDRVVVDGADRLRDGQKVIIPANAAPAAASDGAAPAPPADAPAADPGAVPPVASSDATALVPASGSSHAATDQPATDQATTDQAATDQAATDQAGRRAAHGHRRGDAGAPASP